MYKYEGSVYRGPSFYKGFDFLFGSLLRMVLIFLKLSCVFLGAHMFSDFLTGLFAISGYSGKVFLGFSAGL